MPITSRPGQDQPQQGQTENRQLDGFDDVADMLGNEFNELFKQKNGYLTATEKQLDKFLERLVVANVFFVKCQYNTALIQVVFSFNYIN